MNEIPVSGTPQKGNRTIRNLNLEKDFAKFEELSVISFGEGSNPHQEMYQWLFDNNPYNPHGENLMFAMWDKDRDRMIATDGLVPMELNRRGETFFTAHSVKSMTHPDYKRQGIFRTMTENSLQQGEKQGMDLVIGLANSNSYPAYQKFGWTTLFEREVYILPVNITNKLKGMVKIAPLAKAGNALYQIAAKVKRGNQHALRDIPQCTVEEYDEVPRDAAVCWEKYKEKFEYCIVRDFKYLDFRYNKRPDVRYKTLLIRSGGEPIGYAVLHQSKANGKQMICVAENFTDPENELYIGALAEAISAYCFRRGVDYAVVCSGGFGKFKEVFLRHGFVWQKRRNTIMVAKTFNEKLRVEDLVGAEHWHLSQGDGESELDL